MVVEAGLEARSILTYLASIYEDGQNDVKMQNFKLTTFNSKSHSHCCNQYFFLPRQ